jgi:hypothetical protein
MVGPRWKPEAKRACFWLPIMGAFKTYNNIWEGEKKEIPSQ